jgi:GTP cyclohydrolase II
MSAEPVPVGTPVVERVIETILPTEHGTFRMVGYLGHDGTEHVVLSMGVSDTSSADPLPLGTAAPLVRLHSECLTGDALGSRRCDCGTQLDAALARIAAEGNGALVYVGGHEGRGIGLLEKLKAYHLQDLGADTVDANLMLGHPEDARDYAQAAAILADLGLTAIRLLSSNPAKENALARLGIRVVERTGMFVPEHPENEGYLATKRARMGHDSPGADAWSQLLAGVVPSATSTEDDAELVRRYAGLAAHGTRSCTAQMAQSLDGYVATRSGDGAALSGPEDHRHLHRLRALADAVVLGAQTVTADDPQLTVREVEGAHPVRVILDPHARIPRRSRLLTEAVAPTVWLIGEDANLDRGADAGEVGSHVEVVRLGVEDFEPRRILDLLAERGWPRVLIEGGGRTVSRFLEAGCVDRLFLTSVPVLLGEGVRGIQLEGVEAMRDVARHPTRRFLLGEDVCTELILR